MNIRPRYIILFLLAAMAIVAVAYGKYLNVFYALEDTDYQEVARCHSMREFLALFAQNYDGHNYRPFSTFMPMAITWHLCGANPSVLRLVSYGVLILTALLIYFISAMLFESNTVGLLTGFLFLMHPGSSHVFLLTNFSDILVLFLMMLALLAFIQWRKTGLVRFVAISWISFGMAVFSKENAVLFPFMTVAYDAIFVRRDSRRHCLWSGSALVFYIILLTHLMIRFYFLRIGIPRGGPYAFCANVQKVLYNYFGYIYHTLYGFSPTALFAIIIVLLIGITAKRAACAGGNVHKADTGAPRCPIRAFGFCSVYFLVMQIPVSVMSSVREYHAYCTQWAVLAMVSYCLEGAYRRIKERSICCAASLMTVLLLTLFIYLLYWLRSAAGNNTLIEEELQASIFHEKCVKWIQARFGKFPKGARLYFSGLPFGNFEDPYVHFESLIYLCFDDRPHTISVKLFWPHETVSVPTTGGRAYLFNYRDGGLEYVNMEQRMNPCPTNP